jgi:hypothetical protein
MADLRRARWCPRVFRRTPQFEMKRLEEDVAQLREDLKNAKARVRQWSDECEDSLTRQRKAILRGADDEVNNLKR